MVFLEMGHPRLKPHIALNQPAQAFRPPPLIQGSRAS